MKKQFFYFITAVFIAAALLTGCGSNKSEPPTEPPATRPTAQSREADGSFALGNDLYITELFPYSGAYVEDGSDEAVSSIAAVRLENRSDRHYQYLTFRVETADAVYSFAAGTLFAGAAMTVLEQNRAAYTGGEIRFVSSDAPAEFTETPSVHLETVRITFTDGILNVENLTDAPLSDLYVYYKTIDETGAYFGGITYRAAVGTLEAGKTQQTPAPHLDKDDSRIVFVTYDS